MNAKLQGVLYRAWNEPRHFFLWLALVSLIGLLLAFASNPVIGPTLFFEFVALGCLLCLPVSILAFLLAWIPPVRRLFAWLLTRRFLVLACLVTPVALFYSVENWRGRHAWQSFKREQEVKGERFDLASFIPPRVPEDQNFFASPLWDDLQFVRTNKKVVWRDPNWNNHTIFDVFGPRGNDAPKTGNWSTVRHVDLTAWQAYYRGSNNVFAAGDGKYTNYFPVTRESQTPAADVLLALSRFDTNRQLLLQAAARPQARFWSNYEDGFGAVLPHLARLKATGTYLALHAEAALTAGDHATALEDMRLSFRLLESIRGEPFLISQLVRIALEQIAFQPIWEGLAARQWTEADLKAIEAELGKLDFLADYHLSMRGERAFNLWGVDYIRKEGITGLMQPVPEDEPEWKPLFQGKAAFRLIPAGWFDQNKLSLGLAHERYSLPVVDLQKRTVSPTMARESQVAQKNLRWQPYDVFSRLLMPAYYRAAERFARAQTSVDLARVACALERYRLANGQFPETLPALTPKFIEPLPHDILSSQPLKYRRTGDGQFVLYSIGWNGTDDEGKVALTNSGNPEPDKGDWVWAYTAAAQ